MIDTSADGNFNLKCFPWTEKRTEKQFTTNLAHGESLRAVVDADSFQITTVNTACREVLSDDKSIYT